MHTEKYGDFCRDEFRMDIKLEVSSSNTLCELDPVGAIDAVSEEIFR